MDSPIVVIKLQESTSERELGFDIIYNLLPEDHNRIWREGNYKMVTFKVAI